MTALQQAQDLITKMYQLPYCKESEAKRCALLVADLVIKEYQDYAFNHEADTEVEIKFWEIVKIEIDRF